MHLTGRRKHAVSVSNTGKQQFTANRLFTSIWKKTVVFHMILICDEVFGLVYMVTGVIRLI